MRSYLSRLDLKSIVSLYTQYFSAQIFEFQVSILRIPISAEIFPDKYLFLTIMWTNFHPKLRTYTRTGKNYSSIVQATKANSYDPEIQRQQLIAYDIFRIKIIFKFCKNALAYYNAGVVLVPKFRSRGIESWIQSYDFELQRRHCKNLQ
jgi:hypothetical protein